MHTTSEAASNQMSCGCCGGAAIDLVHLARYTLGNVELEREILDLFAGQAPQTLDRLRTAETERQWREAAHTLKGSARAVGAFALGKAAEAVERTDAWQTPAAKAVAVASVARALDETTAYIAALKAAD